MKKVVFLLIGTALMMLMVGCAGAKESVNISLEAASKEEITNLPQPVGGAETEVRKPQPASNQALQRKFPETLVLHGSYDEKKVALTFDDGPDWRFTPQVLDTLNKYQVKATFFLMGARVQALPDITRRIANEGHIIGNHTFWHPQLYAGTVENMEWEITETNRVIEEATGKKPRLFRAPYGGLNEELMKALQEWNHGVIGWSVDSEDWRGLDAVKVKENVLSQLHPGAIILMHSGGHWTQDLSGMVEALNELIPLLQSKGYEFVTVPELIGLQRA